MTNGERVKLLATRTRTSMSKIANELGISSANLSNKIRRESLNEEELHLIAKVCGARYKSTFILDGKDVE